MVPPLQPLLMLGTVQASYCLEGSPVLQWQQQRTLTSRPCGAAWPPLPLSWQLSA